MAATRSYNGLTADERQAARRARLVEAGLDLIGTDGYDATTVKSICRRAKLTERYFYESFDDRLDLLGAVFEHVVELVAGATAEALAAAPADMEARARAGLGAFVDALTDDPRRARVQLIEVVGRSEQLERRRREVMHLFADVIAAEAGMLLGREDAVARTEVRLVAIGLVGATNEVAIDWTRGHIDTTREELLDTLVELFLAAAERFGPRI